MADATEQAKYIKKASEARSKIKAKGHEVSFGSLDNPISGAGSYGDYREIGLASVLPLEWKADFSSDVLQEDLIFMVTDEVVLSMPLYEVGSDCCDPEVITHMQDNNGILHKIKFIKPLMFDGITVIFYEIQVTG